MGLITSKEAGSQDTVGMAQATSGVQAEHSHQAKQFLPDKPPTTIEQSKSWSHVSLSEVWEYRDLLYFLTWRDVKVRYKQTLLGSLWVIIQPLGTMLVFSVLFGRLAGLDQLTEGIPYPLFAFAGLLPWTFFNNSITSSVNSLVNNSHLITKIYFPRVLIPAAAVTAGLVDFALSFSLVVILLIYYRVQVSWSLLLLAPIVVVTLLLALSLGMLLSALNVKYRDIRHALPFVMQIWMFSSPVIYPTTLVPPNWRWVLALNPMTGIIEGFRASLFRGHDIEWSLLAISTGVTLVLMVCSAFAFKRLEQSFADVI